MEMDIPMELFFSHIRFSATQLPSTNELLLHGPELCQEISIQIQIYKENSEPQQPGLTRLMHVEIHSNTEQ